MVEVRRTAVIKLDVPADADQALHETVEQFRHCANSAAEWCWHGDGRFHVTSKAKAERALYDRLRNETDLTANLVQKAIRRAVEAVKSGVARLKRGERTSRPTFTADSVVYDKRSATFSRDKVSLSTPNGRIGCEYVLPDEESKPPTKYLTDEWEFRQAILQRRGGEWFLHASMLSYRSDEGTDETGTEHGTVLGVDLGVRNLAVASTGTFCTGDEFDHWRREYERRRASMAQNGSRHAHEAIQSVGRTQYDRFEHMLHRVANDLIAEARDYGCRVIVFEDLTHIRERLPSAGWQHVWAFRRLFQYTEYKAAEHGIEAVQVDPQNTSRRCSMCGFTTKANRDGESFACQSCGYANHADYNAAKNIGYQYLRRRQNAAVGGAPVGVGLNRGTLNVSGEYITPSDRYC